MTEVMLIRDLLIYLCSIPHCMAWRSQPLRARVPGGRVLTALPVGHADIAGVIGSPTPSGPLLGRALFVEAKSATGRQSPSQRNFQAAVTQRGALYVLARSVEDVRRALIAEGLLDSRTADRPAVP
ncbi:MAG: hypothetical protein ACYDCP_07015 [Thermoplasmataceae archaeon]